MTPKRRKRQNVKKVYLLVCLGRLTPHDNKSRRKNTKQENKKKKKTYRKKVHLRVCLGRKFTCGYALEGLLHMTNCGGGELPLLSAEY